MHPPLAVRLSFKLTPSTSLFASRECLRFIVEAYACTHRKLSVPALCLVPPHRQCTYEVGERQHVMYSRALIKVRGAGGVVGYYTVLLYVIT